jgi:hypothetical protein
MSNGKIMVSDAGAAAVVVAMEEVGGTDVLV